MLTRPGLARRRSAAVAVADRRADVRQRSSSSCSATVARRPRRSRPWRRWPLTQIRIDVARELHPPRVHAGTPEPGRRPGAQPAARAARRCSACTTRCRAPGAPACWSARWRRASRPGPPTGCRPSGGASSTSDRSTSSSPTRSASPGCRMTATGASELTVYPHIDELAPLPHDHRQRPAGRRRAPQLARPGRRGLLRPARLRRRRRPPPGALAVDRPPRRAHGAPGRAAVAGPGHRAGRRPLVDQHRRVARAGHLGRRPASSPPAPAARTSSA